jgi:hypothetical protein
MATARRNPIRNAVRKVEYAAVYVLDHFFNDGEGYRAAKRNQSRRAARHRAMKRLQDWKERGRPADPPF